MRRSKSVVRRYKTFHRLLVEIDVLAPRRLGLRTSEIHEALREHDIDVCEDTVKRDMYFLHVTGLIHQRRSGNHVRWVLNLRESANLQKAAIVTEARREQPTE